MKTLTVSVLITLLSFLSTRTLCALPFIKIDTQPSWPEVSDIKLFQYNTTVSLQWTANSEASDLYYEIEKSADGITFKTAAMVLGGEQLNSRYTYTFKLKQTPNEKIIYRIWQVKKDGSSRLVGEQSYQK